MRFQIPSYSVCTPMEKGMMIQPSLRLMGVVPLLVMLPRIRTSIELYGSPAHNRHGLQSSPGSTTCVRQGQGHDAATLQP